MTRYLFIILSALVLVTVSPAQRLASYDHTAFPQELAASRCPPLAPAPITRHLVHPIPPAHSWWFGAIAADNVNQALHYCDGHPASGIQRASYASIAAGGGAPFTYNTPPGFNQVTGMVVDNTTAPSGRVLWISDGFSIVQYQTPTVAFTNGLVLNGPFNWAAPAACGTRLTGLTYDPWNNVIIAIDDGSCLHTFDPVALVWTGVVPPAVGVPNQATGVQICLATGGTFATYTNGMCRSPLTGANVPLPPAPGGAIRRHHGLTFFGQPVVLPGLSGGPGLELIGTPWVGNSGFGLAVAPTATGQVMLGIDLGANEGFAVTSFGVVHIDPQAAIILDLGAINGPVFLPLSLVGVPPGIGLTFQALGITASGAALSDGLWMQTFRVQ
ncbi:MAG: hypothetical protein CMJ83_04200 [Planctomycetes bacterium]|nr:hypothetical protein [Planctomycetota bacterium]